MSGRRSIIATTPLCTKSTLKDLYYLHLPCILKYLQSEIVKRLSAIVGQVLPFLSQEHQQQVATAVERAKQVTMSELNSVIGVSNEIIIKPT